MAPAATTLMSITLRYYAYLKDHFGCSEERMELPAGASVAEMKARWLEAHPKEGGTLNFVRIAVGDAYVDADQVLYADDEVAFLPPVSGGSGDVSRQHVRLSSEAFRPGQAEELLDCDGAGATVTFRGIIREHSEGKIVRTLSYEARESMALSLMEKEREKALARGDITDVAIWHRLGTLEVGELAVEIAVSSPHRAASFEVARAIIEAFKTDIPVFKREVFADGTEQWKDRCH